MAKRTTEQAAKLAAYKGYETNSVKNRIIELARLVGEVSPKDGERIMKLACRLEHWQHTGR